MSYIVEMIDTPDQNDLGQEVQIVWEEPIDKLAYVREATTLERTNSRRPPRCPPGGRRIGYSVLSRSAQPASMGNYVRRVFWLKSYDRNGIFPDKTYESGSPAESVDPRTVKPRERGHKTDRSKGFIGEA